MQQEMIRLHRGEENALTAAGREGLSADDGSWCGEVLEEGMRIGRADPGRSSCRSCYAALGANVFYFLSAPVMRMVLEIDPLERSALEFRRKAAIEYLGQTIFIDREHGARVAARVLAATPMPEPTADLSRNATFQWPQYRSCPNVCR